MDRISASNIKVFDDNDFVIRINSKFYSSLDFGRKIRGYVSYGTQKCYVDINISQDEEDNDIYLSRKVMDYLYLPDYPDFDARIKGEEIVIGPHLGIIADHQLTDSYLKYALEFIPEYSKLHGSVIIFTLDKIDQSKHLVEGCCYNPKSQSWVSGVFPYPQAIFLKLLLDTDLKNHFLSTIGNTLFNNFFIGKYKMHKLLSRNPAFVPYLPDTILYNSSQDIFNMLEKYSQVYVKSISGQCGKKVARINRDEDGRIAIRYRQKKNNAEDFVEDSSDGREAIEKFFIPNRYIVQQGLDLMTYEGRPFDFRHVIQKDDTGEWVSKGVIGRIAAPGSVVSNISNGGKAMLGAELLKKVLNMSDAKASDMVNDMVYLGSSICNELDKSGILYGDLGIDIGIDRNKKMWIIEINSRGPDPYIAMSINDKALYKELLSTPLLYAKYLSGFSKQPLKVHQQGRGDFHQWIRKIKEKYL